MVSHSKMMHIFDRTSGSVHFNDVVPYETTVFGTFLCVCVHIYYYYYTWLNWKITLLHAALLHLYIYIFSNKTPVCVFLSIGAF